MANIYKELNSNYQVLNISNVNAQNEVVLNDEQLLILIHSYPFLYNPHVRPSKDSDYDNWAWEQIAKSFNRLYEKTNRNVWYTSTELMERWKVLQPIVKSLSKISNLKSLPDSLRQTIVKISVPLDEKPKESQKKILSPAQKVILDYVPFVNQLPMVHRKRLEAEMMELLLSSELESKATIKIGPTDLEIIDKECNEIVKELKFNELDMLNEAEISTEAEEIKQKVKRNVKAESTKKLRLILPKIKYEVEESLLTPMQTSKYVPLHNWTNYVRKCRVRVKRLKRDALEDHIPLAQIKREKKEPYSFGF